MMAPRRRLWLYALDTERDALEITVLGPLDDIAQLCATIKSSAEQWPGFARVAIIGSGSTVCVMRMFITNRAHSDDALTEGMLMLADMEGKGALPRLSWTASLFPANIGAVGTW
jgi:hypothetical protein